MNLKLFVLAGQRHNVTELCLFLPNTQNFKLVELHHLCFFADLIWPTVVHDEMRCNPEALQAVGIAIYMLPR